MTFAALVIKDEQHRIQRFSVISMGSEAARMICEDQTARVIAVFERSLYIQSQSGVLCIGVESIGRGPLHILLDRHWSESGCTIGSEQRISLCGNERLSNSGYLTSPLIYSGKISDKQERPIKPADFSNGALYHLPTEHAGFAWILDNRYWQCNDLLALNLESTQLDLINMALCKQCLPALKSLIRWLDRSLARDSPLGFIDKLSHTSLQDDCSANTAINPLSSVHGLLGAGPGLTPSGDDLLAGVLLALNRIGHSKLASDLWNTLQPQVKQRTHLISEAHLQLAACGQCSEAAAQLLECIFDVQINKQDAGADGVPSAIDTLIKGMGASSGWDTLAGISLVWRFNAAASFQEI